MSLLWRLRALLIAALLPLAALLLWGGYAQWRHAVAEAERTVLQQARGVAAGLSGRLTGAREAVTSIALRARDEGFDPASCNQYLGVVVASGPLYPGAAVLGRDGRVWCRSGVTPSVNRDLLLAALNSEGPVVGTATDAGRPLLAAAYRDAAGRAVGVALLSLDPQRLALSFATSSTGFAALVDRQGSVVAPLAGSPTLDSVIRDAFASVAAGDENDENSVAALDAGGASYVVAAAPVQPGEAGWLAVVGADRAALLAPARSALWQYSLLVTLGLVLAFISGGLVGRRLVRRPLHGVLDAAPAPSEARAGRSEFDRLRAALQALAGQAARAGQGKEAAIREAHHRVMNSLHLLGAILHLQSRQISDEGLRRHMDEARERVVAVSLIYRHLCESAATQTVDFALLLRGFCQETSEAYGGKPVEVDADPVELPIEPAMNLALVVHEILVRALEQPGGADAGALRVELRRRDDGLRLELIEPRPGSAGFAAESSRSLSMMLVQSLSRQLRGRFTVERRGAATVMAVSVPLSVGAMADAGHRAVA